ncbi:MAG: hypothetical protein EXX96DRAFT_516992 [Benjaminiella poitrasii]|nr:MAG: hypothetical protein EXX96DRAFT_516992 [Benjaminiella poitrasii]
MSYNVYTISKYEDSEVDPQDDVWEDWSNDEEEQEDSQCLFCSTTFPRPSAASQHMKTVHNFDFQAVRQSLHLDFYQCIRMINYIRKQVQNNSDFNANNVKSFTGKENFWTDDAYLQPTMPDDSLLFTFEDMDEGDDTDNSIDEQKEAQTTSTLSFTDLSKVKPTTDLERQLLELLRTSQDTLENLKGQFDEYKAMVKKTWRARLGEILENEKFHMIVLGLVLLDATSVMVQLLYTFFHECQSPPLFIKSKVSYLYIAFEIAEIISIFLCILFLIECACSFIAFGPKYYLPGWPHWKLHLFDATVVITTFILELGLRGKEREVAGLLIILRFWRVVKVVEATIRSISFTHEEELEQLKSDYAKLEAKYNLVVSQRQRQEEEEE